MPHGSPCWPEYLLLLLEQGDQLLEDHTRRFLLVANVTSYPDDTLCAVYDASLNTMCRALSSKDGPQEEFSAFVEWTGDPLQTQSPAHLLPAVQSPSPPMMESHFPPRSVSQRKAERLSRGSPQKLSPTRQIRCESQGQCLP